MESKYIGTKIDGHTIEDVYMMDENTCCISFKEEMENDGSFVIVVEYWRDEVKWVFQDLWYELNGDYIDGVECMHLTSEGKEKCKEIIKEFINQIK